MNETTYAILAVTLWNFITFVICGIDKRKAVKGKRRISEKTLILCTFLIGGVGAFWGMGIFRHKTKHWKFIICVPLAALLNIAVIAFIWIKLGVNI